MYYVASTVKSNGSKQPDHHRISYHTKERFIRSITWSICPDEQVKDSYVNVLGSDMSILGKIPVEEWSKIHPEIDWLFKHISSSQNVWSPNILTRVSIWLDSISSRLHEKDIQTLKQERYPELAAYEIIKKLFKLVDGQRKKLDNIKVHKVMPRVQDKKLI